MLTLLRHCFRLTIVLLLLLISNSALRAQKLQVSPSSYDFKPLDQVLDQNQKSLDKNLTMLVYKNSKLIYAREMGDAKANMPAEIASTSKWLTAALALVLADQGKIALDEKVSTYLPIFKTYGKGYITIRQCLTHFTGLAAPSLGSIHIGHYANLEEEVNDLAAKREIQTNPGTEFRYTDAGYAIVGRVLEVVSKKPFDRLAKETLFRPLNMLKSTFSTMGDKAVDPAEGAQCTPSELMNFTSMILDKGVFNGKRILSDNAISELLKVETTSAQIKSFPTGTDTYNYALGSWIEATDAGGAPAAYWAPSLTGSWALVNASEGYAAVLVVNKAFNEPKKQAFISIKDVLDGILKQ